MIRPDAGRMLPAVRGRTRNTHTTAPHTRFTCSVSLACASRPVSRRKDARRKWCDAVEALEEEEEVRTASLTPVGHMLMPEKKRGAPPSSSVGQQTATLRPVRGTLTPVSKTPVKRLEPNDETDED